MVMVQLTLRGVDETLHEALRLAAQERGLSVNRYVLQLLQSAVKRTRPIQPTTYHDLDGFFGTWSAEEGEAFAHASSVFAEIDQEMWQ